MLALLENLTREQKQNISDNLSRTEIARINIKFENAYVKTIKT